MAVFGIGGIVDQPAAIRPRSQELEPRLYPTVRSFYLQNVGTENFHIRQLGPISKVLPLPSVWFPTLQFDSPNRVSDHYYGVE
jgi:hypothetical protein